MKKQYNTVLTIAGSDSSGGAGIQADLKTMTVLGCYGASVITALTAQNTLGVEGIFPVPAEFVEKQLDAVFKDLSIDVVKIGMLYDFKTIQIVVKKLKEYSKGKVVLDPVMVATSGNRLMRENALSHLKNELVPLTTLITPNSSEAEVLTGMKVRNQEEIKYAALKISQLGCKSVLIKGGDIPGKFADDYLYSQENNQTAEFWFHSHKIDSENTHGTGCTLSSAIASFMAKGKTIHESVKLAKNFITQAIESGKQYQIGKGKGPLKHFYIENF